MTVIVGMGRKPHIVLIALGVADVAPVLLIDRVVRIERGGSAVRSNRLAAVLAFQERINRSSLLLVIVMVLAYCEVTPS